MRCSHSMQLERHVLQCLSPLHCAPQPQSVHNNSMTFSFPLLMLANQALLQSSLHDSKLCTAQTVHGVRSFICSCWPCSPQQSTWPSWSPAISCRAAQLPWSDQVLLHSRLRQAAGDEPGLEGGVWSPQCGLLCPALHVCLPNGACRSLVCSIPFHDANSRWVLGLLACKTEAASPRGGPCIPCLLATPYAQGCWAPDSFFEMPTAGAARPAHPGTVTKPSFQCACTGAPSMQYKSSEVSAPLHHVPVQLHTDQLSASAKMLN